MVLFYFCYSCKLYFFFICDSVFPVTDLSQYRGIDWLIDWFIFPFTAIHINYYNRKRFNSKGLAVHDIILLILLLGILSVLFLFLVLSSLFVVISTTLIPSFPHRTSPYFIPRGRCLFGYYSYYSRYHSFTIITDKSQHLLLLFSDTAFIFHFISV